MRIIALLAFMVIAGCATQPEPLPTLRDGCAYATINDKLEILCLEPDQPPVFIPADPLTFEI